MILRKRLCKKAVEELFSVPFRACIRHFFLDKLEKWCYIAVQQNKGQTKNIGKELPLDHRITSAHRAKLFIALFSLLTLLLLGFLIYNTIRLNRITIETGMTDEYLMQCNQAGDLLQTGSDILTNAVRNYIVSGNKEYRDAYFKEAYVDKHREAASRKSPFYRMEKSLRRYWSTA